MASMTSMFLVFALATLVRPSEGNAFLKKGNETDRLTQLLNGSTIKQLLLDEVAGFTGKGPADLQLPTIEKALEPMWLALPKNEYGNLDSSQVQYAIHRFFVQSHGWHIDGLGKVGAAEKGASPSIGVLRERVSSFLMEVFEEALGVTGLNLHELSIFAATLEHLIHDEVTDRLKDVYQVLGKQTDTTLTGPEVDVAVDSFLMSLVLGKHRLAAPGSLKTKFEKFAKVYPGWSNTQSFLREVQQTVTFEDVTTPSGSFAQVENVVEQVSREFGRFQDNECRHLKDTLLGAEERDTGRVLLSDFYKKGLEANVLFKENVDYLRQQGALDESKPGEPRVIVPNFILSPGNCLADTGFYSICCINECEGLLGHLERMIGAPEATPDRIVEIVQGLASSTVEAPRSLSNRLISQIELVAMRHGGKVPLHSRSLAQWLHVAYPHECPYPHTAAATSSLTTAEMRAAQATSKLDAESRTQYIDSIQPVEAEEVAAEAEEDLLSKWSHEEEILYMPAKQTSAVWKLAVSAMRTLGFLAALGGVAAALTELVKRSRGGMIAKSGRGGMSAFDEGKSKMV